jgi:hypothetical protein
MEEAPSGEADERARDEERVAVVVFLQALALEGRPTASAALRSAARRIASGEHHQPVVAASESPESLEPCPRCGQSPPGIDCTFRTCALR